MGRPIPDFQNGTHISIKPSSFTINQLIESPCWSQLGLTRKDANKLAVTIMTTKNVIDLPVETDMWMPITVPPMDGFIWKVVETRRHPMLILQLHHNGFRMRYDRFVTMGAEPRAEGVNPHLVIKRKWTGDDLPVLPDFVLQFSHEVAQGALHRYQ